MNSGSSPCAPRYFELTSMLRAALNLAARAEIAARRAGNARGRAGIGAGELGDHALHRAARRELHHHERHQHDPEQGRDHEQDAADDIGAHADSIPLSVMPRRAVSLDAGRRLRVSHYSRRWPEQPVAYALALARFSRLVAVIPPGFRNAAEITRLCRRTAEHIPIGDPVRGLVPVRNPIAAGADHAIERAAGGHQSRRGCRRR